MTVAAPEGRIARNSAAAAASSAEWGGCANGLVAGDKAPFDRVGTASGEGGGGSGVGVDVTVGAGAGVAVVVGAACVTVGIGIVGAAAGCWGAAVDGGVVGFSVGDSGVGVAGVPQAAIANRRIDRHRKMVSFNGLITTLTLQEARPTCPPKREGISTTVAVSLQKHGTDLNSAASSYG